MGLHLHSYPDGYDVALMNAGRHWQTIAAEVKCLYAIAAESGGAAHKGGG